MNESHWVYEVYMASGACAYVGMTNNLRRRINEHKRKQPWWDAPGTTVKATECTDRRAAEELEMDRIDELQPANNIRGKDRAEVVAAWALQDIAWATSSP